MLLHAGWADSHGYLDKPADPSGNTVRSAGSREQRSV